MEERFPSTKKKKLEGLVVGIPYSDDQMIQGVVLWQSFYYKNCILIGIFDVSLSIDRNEENLGNPISMIYTGAQLIRSGDWKIMGQTELTWPVEISERIIASQIWIGDKYDRDASDEDRKRYPVMSVAGGGAVESYIRYLLALEEGKKMHLKIKTEMQYLLRTFLKENG